MDLDIGTDNDNKRLNRLVAITVVLRSVQKAKSESVDAGTEY